MCSDAAKSLKNNIQVFYAEQEEQITLSFNFTVLPFDQVQVEWIFNNYKENVTVEENSVRTTRMEDKIHQTKYTITSVKNNHFGTYFIKIRNNKRYPELKEAEFNITFELKGGSVFIVLFHLYLLLTYYNKLMDYYYILPKVA